MTKHATGTFEVQMISQSENANDGNTLARMTGEKQFHGAIEGTSKVEMLSAVTATKGSAAYVAIERVLATLDGRTGTFVLQHSGTMTRGTPMLSVTVVPDSGTGRLAGISGSMTIKIEDGKHFYDFEYTMGGK